MANLQDLNLNDEGISEADFENMPQTVGSGGRMPPQPGIYRFRLPVLSALASCFEPLNTSDQGQKLVAVLQDEAALFNVTLGEWYNARINNRTRIIKGRNDNPDRVVSDMGMLLKALKVKPEPVNGIVTNKSYGDALISAAGREFIAEHTLTASCDKARDIYKDGKVQVGEKGCGQRYRVQGYAGRDGKPDVMTLPKTPDGKVALRFGCKCTAELRCWSELGGFRPAD